MSLSKSIVIVNEYTIKFKTTSKGSRGSTPGDYITRYMARKDACELAAPVKLYDQDDYITRYMARADATEPIYKGTSKTKPDGRRKDEATVKKELNDSTKLGGIAFGRHRSSEIDLSMSHESIHALARNVNKSFDEGKTVLKTVISFTEDYLKEVKVVDKDFTCDKKGDYKGQVDQMKLRVAISEGIDRLSKQYDNLEWAAVLQFDTKHVHAHLCMVDTGIGDITDDGTQRGKISSAAKSKLRRGIDASLTQNMHMKDLPQTISQERRNIKLMLDAYRIKSAHESTFTQDLIAALPENKNHWRAKTNRKDMKRANKMTRDYVETYLSDSKEFKNLMINIENYAEARRSREGLDDDEVAKLKSNGRAKVVDDCVNNIYKSIKDNLKIENNTKTATPFLNHSSKSIEAIESEDELDSDLYRFVKGAKVYNKRLEEHIAKRNYYQELMDEYEDHFDGNISEYDDSYVMYEHYKFEHDYHTRLMCKYQHSLGVKGSPREFQSELDAINERKRYADAIFNLDNDPNTKHMSEHELEYRGFQDYGVRRTHLLLINRSKAMSLASAGNDNYVKDKDELLKTIESHGLEYDESGEFITHGIIHSFADTKGLDLHDIRSDFKDGLSVNTNVSDSYKALTNERRTTVERAYKYLIDTGQIDLLDGLPIDEVQSMIETSNLLGDDGTIDFTESLSAYKNDKVKTVSLDINITEELNSAINESLDSNHDMDVLSM